MAARLRLEVLVELSSRAVLKNEVDFILVVKEAIELNDILVAQVTVDLDLSP